MQSAAQDIVDFNKHIIKVQKLREFDPKTIEPSFKARIENLEAPVPGGESYRSGLLELKNKSRLKYPLTNQKSATIPQNLEYPKYLEGFPMRRYIAAFDTLVYVAGGTPLDNTLAISNDNYLMCSVNSTIYMHDLNQGLVATEDNVKVIDFDDFAGNISTSSPFDPKLIYDPEQDRFIVVYLTGRNPNNSGIIVGFSQTNDPMDTWNVYLLSGNPLNNNTWTDYPAISLSKGELFITVNLLIPNVDWKVGFSSTIIWQIDKFTGYSGSNTLSTQLWSDISLDGRNLRNLGTIKGADSLEGPNMYFLSNRNFDIENDTTFLVELTGSMNDPDATIEITPLIASQKYGLPPNGRQANSDPNDPDDGFDTNDARVLGGFKKGNSIQFVGNSMNFSTGLAGIYHGFIDNLDTGPTIHANIIGSDSLDYGYPNIAFTGQNACENSSMIAFNHTSPTVFSGTSIIRYKDGDYSPQLFLKEGENYVDRISGSYERWGDYYGIQRKYNEPGVVWTAGFFGRENKSSATWIGKLTDVDDCECVKPFCECVEPMTISFDKGITSDTNLCKSQFTLNVNNGVGPYTYYWNGELLDSNNVIANLCEDNVATVKDAMGCEQSITYYSSLPPNEAKIYPNPVNDRFKVYFELEEGATIDVKIYSADGKFAKQIIDKRSALAGKNILTFSIEPLVSGIYIVVITAGEKEVYNGKITVNNY